MKRFFTYFFVVMGVIFTLLLLVLLYLWVADPFGIRPFLTQSASTSSESGVIVEGSETTVVGDAERAVEDDSDQNPYLTPAQEDALSLVGIDPAGLPATITPEQMSCFERVIGADRVNEIKAGDAPTPLELLKGNECL